MRWIAIFALLLCLGCGPAVPEGPKPFQTGDIVYHKLNGTKMIVTREGFSNYWYVRYEIGEGQMFEDDFLASELSKEPIPGLQE